MLVQARVGGDRPDEALPALAAGHEAGERFAGREQHGVVGDGGVDRREVTPDLFLGRPARRQTDGKPGDGRRRTVQDGEVFLEGEAEEGDVAVVTRQLAQQVADRRIAVAGRHAVDH